MDSTTISLKRQTRDVILRIFVFILVYLLLIAVGATLIYFSLKLAFWAFPEIFRIRNIRGIIVMLLIIIGGVGFTLMFGLYLIKFLFSRTKNLNTRRREVTEKECPELFQAISEVAQATTCPMPKKVFLSPDVNACVFYNTTFWSIFFPVRKNLEIGLGLFTCTNVDELKSILAHEFGHFSQKSMKVGSGVYVANTVLYNLAYKEDGWDRFVDRWCRVDIGILALFGIMTRGFTNQIRKLLHRMYRFVNRSYMKLSRTMEYDADAIACRYIGKEVFSSALRKIDYLAYTNEAALGVINHLAANGKKVNSIFDVHEAMTRIIAENDKLTVDCRSLITANVDYGYPESRIRMENIWDTHPSMQDRINFAVGNVEKDTDFRSSWELLPTNLIEDVSGIVLVNVFPEESNEAVLVSNEELVEICREFYNKNSIPRSYAVFLNRNILLPEREALTCGECENPFTPENTALIKEFEVAVGDWQQLVGINEKHIEVEKVYYQGKEYSHKSLPLDLHRQYLESLSEKVKQVDENIFKYALQGADAEKTKAIYFLYDALVYSMEEKEKYYDDIHNRINVIVYNFNRGIAFTEEEVKSLTQFTIEFQGIVKTMINEGNWELITQVVEDGKEYMEKIRDFAKGENYASSTNVLSSENLNNILNNAAAYLSLLDSVNWKAKSRLANYFIQKAAA